MALSGTSLTVTTFTTAGLLTNNTSGQVSSVTGASLAALLGGAPTFTGLKLSGLSSAMLKVDGAGNVVQASSVTDYQTPITAGNNMAFTGSAIGTVTTPSFTGLTLSGLATGLLKVTAGIVSVAPTSDYQYSQGSNITISSGTISTSATPSFTGLTLSGLATGLLKVTAGVVGLAAAGTDYLSALTAGTNITISNNIVATTTLPTFAGINCSSIGNQNTLYGTDAGINLLANSSSGNTFIGYQTGMSCTSGSNNLYIGKAANASSGAVANEGVINLTGSSIAGRGANTMLINSTAGLYSYIPAYWWGYASSQIGGILNWNLFSARGIALKVGDATQLILPFNGLYELTLSGSIYHGIGSVQTLSMFLNGNPYITSPCYYFNRTPSEQPGNIGWEAISLSAFVQVVIPNTYIQYTITSQLQTSTSAPTILTAKFISL